jgi:hypothetical protein
MGTIARRRFRASRMTERVKATAGRELRERAFPFGNGMVPASSRAAHGRRLDKRPIPGLAPQTGSQEQSVKLAVTMELYAYWNRLRGPRSAPERNDVDPGAVRSVLADTFVLDFDDRLGFPFRIAGSRANSLFLKELRGLSFLELWREADRKDLSSVLHCVADEAQPFLAGAEARPPGLGSVNIEVILLPLRHHGLTHSRVLGGLAVDAAPTWMGLVGAGQITLRSLRALGASTQRGAQPDGAAPTGFSVRNPPKRYKHLFVYSGGGRPDVNGHRGA